MSKDCSNFFELPNEKQEELCKEGDIAIDGEKLKKYLEDFPPSAIEFLKNIVNDVKTKDTPYVMSIEGGFGTGKTHFVTRLCKYLQGDGTSENSARVCLKRTDIGAGLMLEQKRAMRDLQLISMPSFINEKGEKRIGATTGEELAKFCGLKWSRKKIGR